MAVKNQDPEFRHPETAAHLQCPTEEKTEKHPPLIRELGGIITRQWRGSGDVHCRDIKAEEFFLDWRDCIRPR